MAALVFIRVFLSSTLGLGSPRLGLVIMHDRAPDHTVVGAEI
jgi:hypothetical protein